MMREAMGSHSGFDAGQLIKSLGDSKYYKIRIRIETLKLPTIKPEPVPGESETLEAMTEYTSP